MQREVNFNLSWKLMFYKVIRPWKGSKWKEERLKEMDKIIEWDK